jgi:hypothetical protein
MPYTTETVVPAISAKVGFDGPLRWMTAPAYTLTYVVTPTPTPCGVTKREADAEPAPAKPYTTTRVYPVMTANIAWDGPPHWVTYPAETVTYVVTPRDVPSAQSTRAEPIEEREAMPEPTAAPNWKPYMTTRVYPPMTANMAWDGPPHWITVPAQTVMYMVTPRAEPTQAEAVRERKAEAKPTGKPYMTTRVYPPMTANMAWDGPPHYITVPAQTVTYVVTPTPGLEDREPEPVFRPKPKPFDGAKAKPTDFGVPPNEHAGNPA